LFKVTNAKLCKPIFAQLVRKFSAFYETWNANILFWEEHINLS
jgi:hypothetical protein